MKLHLKTEWINAVALSLMLSIAGLALLGCAQYPRGEINQRVVLGSERWHGRIAISIASSPKQAFSADFELQGNSQIGQMTLSSPLGTTLAQMQWSAQQAQLLVGGTERHYSSLSELTLVTMGAELPVEALLQWLKGIPAQSDGWHSDLSEFNTGRLTAYRFAPGPRVDLKILLDR